MCIIVLLLIPQYNGIFCVYQLFFIGKVELSPIGKFFWMSEQHEIQLDQKLEDLYLQCLNKLELMTLNDNMILNIKGTPTVYKDIYIFQPNLQIRF